MSSPVNAKTAASQQTRTELLEAGLRLLLELPASAVFGHLTASRIAQEAGRTTGAFFHQWPTIDAYLNDFVGYVLHPKMSVMLEQTTDRLVTALGQGVSFADALRDASRDLPQLTARDPQAVMELLLWTRALHDEEFRARSAAHYAALDQASAPVYESLMRLLGREPRPPFTPETIAGVCAATAEGLALRATLTPGFYPEHIYGLVVLALIPLLTRHPDDTQDASEWVNALGLDLQRDAD